MGQKIMLLFFVAIVCTAKAQTVTLDYFFNHEFRTTKEGTTERFHYTWEDTTNSGYAVWGNLFRSNGFQTKSLEAAPTLQNLKGTDIYIIVDPDTKKETSDPHFIEATAIKAITDWVKAGGVLVMLANDSANIELAHFNKLAEVFGLHFNANNRNLVEGNKFEMGALTIPANHPIFKTARKIYLKEICTFTLSGEAKPAFTEGGDIIMATAKYGRGTVFAIGDPFIYNEYCNGRLPAGFDNDKAADDVCKWLKQQVTL
jgi:unsaturated rhamnogalacturonyl hydrolase